jgi:hypothetical protein
LAEAGVDFWPGCGWSQLARDERGWLHPNDDWLRLILGRPELAPVDESCASERARHAALVEVPTREVTADWLARLQDADARENYAVFLHFRDALLAAGATLVRLGDTVLRTSTAGPAALALVNRALGRW